MMNSIESYNLMAECLSESSTHQKEDISDCNNNDPNVEEKLKVDRKKFEALLEGNDPKNGSAEDFFNSVKALFPSVVITWPQKLKPGTKSKKDPHVKISGIPLMVKAARIKILESLDPRRDRVTLKMDIDWTAHSHIIGKAGASIQKVMDKTGCHVHFPDANRTNAIEKSNQVSISGSPSGVKDARTQIRELLPIIIWFNLLFKTNCRPVFLDRLNRVIQFVERMTSIQITLRFNAKAYQSLESTTITIFVRGVYGKSNLISLGIELLLNFVKEFSIKEEITYQLNTEISANHQNFVTGFDRSNLRSIMRNTGAIITFPDHKDTIGEDNILNRFSLMSLSASLPRKTTVSIYGSTVNGVLMALHLIELQIPLSLTFDLKEGQEVDTQTIEMLSNKWNVFISVKPKPKQNSRTVWIKAAEKDEWKLFEVRRHLIDEQSISDSSVDTIWTNNDSDIWAFNHSQQDISSPDSSKGDYSCFERAPGAERNTRFF